MLPACVVCQLHSKADVAPCLIRRHPCSSKAFRIQLWQKNLSTIQQSQLLAHWSEVISKAFLSQLFKSHATLPSSSQQLQQVAAEVGLHVLRGVKRGKESVPVPALVPDIVSYRVTDCLFEHFQKTYLKDITRCHSAHLHLQSLLGWPTGMGAFQGQSGNGSTHASESN